MCCHLNVNFKIINIMLCDDFIVDLTQIMWWLQLKYYRLLTLVLLCFLETKQHQVANLVFPNADVHCQNYQTDNPMFLQDLANAGVGGTMGTQTVLCLLKICSYSWGKSELSGCFTGHSHIFLKLLSLLNKRCHCLLDDRDHEVVPRRDGTLHP